MKYNAIDLFCGGGGFSKGFEDANFKIVSAFDDEDSLKKTFNLNHKYKTFITLDLSKGEIPYKYSDIDVVFGSPPCQGFSDARGCRDPQNDAEFRRNNLPFSFIEIVNQLQPKIVLMENVSGIMTYKHKNRKILDIICEKFHEIGYAFTYKLLDSVKFGVPQKRKRVFCLAIKKEYKLTPVLIEHDLDLFFKNPENWRTVEMAISDIQSPLSYSSTYSLDLAKCNKYQQMMRQNLKKNELLNHEIVTEPNEKDLEIIKRLPEGTMYRSNRFGESCKGVWNVFSHKLQPDEQEMLYFISKKRSLKEYKEKQGKYGNGYIRLEKFPVDQNGFFNVKTRFSHENTRTPEEILSSLETNGWIRSKWFVKNDLKFKAWDINTQSGLHSKYRRLVCSKPARTLTTISFTARDLLHPIKNRPITIREGARLQSFPDDFIFPKDNNISAKILGNAVPPLLALELGKYLQILLKTINTKNDSELKKLLRKHELLIEYKAPKQVLLTDFF